MIGPVAPLKNLAGKFRDETCNPGPDGRWRPILFIAVAPPRYQELDALGGGGGNDRGHRSINSNHITLRKCVCVCVLPCVRARVCARVCITTTCCSPPPPPSSLLLPPPLPQPQPQCLVLVSVPCTLRALVAHA